MIIRIAFITAFGLVYGVLRYLFGTKIILFILPLLAVGLIAVVAYLILGVNTRVISIWKRLWAVSFAMIFLYFIFRVYF